MAIRIVNIGGKQIGLKASGLTPILYRREFGRDAISDIAALTKVRDKMAMLEDQSDMEQVADAHFDLKTLNIYADFAYIMAKQYGGDAIPNSRDEWLDSLESLSIYELLNDVIGLLAENQQVTAKSKKK